MCPTGRAAAGPDPHSRSPGRTPEIGCGDRRPSGPPAGCGDLARSGPRHDRHIRRPHGGARQEVAISPAHQVLEIATSPLSVRPRSGVGTSHRLGAGPVPQPISRPYARDRLWGPPTSSPRARRHSRSTRRTPEIGCGDRRPSGPPAGCGDLARSGPRHHRHIHRPHGGARREVAISPAQEGLEIATSGPAPHLSPPARRRAPPRPPPPARPPAASTGRPTRCCGRSCRTGTAAGRSRRSAVRGPPGRGPRARGR